MGGLWLEKHRQSQVRGALGLRGVASPRPRVSMALRGPVGRAGGEEGPAAAAGGGEGLRRGLGPPCPLLVPDQGFCFPSGAGPSLPLASVSQVTLGVAGPAPI